MATTEKQSTVETLNFWTTGEDFTRLIRDFISEGQYKKAYLTLKDGGLPETHIKLFFLYTLKFEGDTRKDPDLHVVSETKDNLTDPDLRKILFYGIKTVIQDMTHNVNYDLTSIKYLAERIEEKGFDQLKERYEINLYYLFKVFELDEIINLIYPMVLQEDGYKLYRYGESIEDLRIGFDGVILSNGEIVKCGFQDHVNLYPVLFSMNLVDASEWTKETTALHITSGQVSGTLGYSLLNRYREDHNITKKQLKQLFNCKELLHGIYGEFGKEGDRSILNHILKYLSHDYNHGGKYNNLSFLKQFYNFRLPKFSKERFDGACIRTSPKYSIAGLLNSKFNVTDYDKAVKEIEADFEKYKDVVGSYVPFGKKEPVTGNKLHIFYQEFLEGDNGVCHYYYESDEFNYSVAKQQGDVVKGKQSEDRLDGLLELELEHISRTLSKDFKLPVQLEFVIHNGLVFIVQMRLLKNNPKELQHSYDEDEIIASGKSFSSGLYVGSIDDVLVIDSDCESEDLIGKKALIVRSDVEFSHALALSKSLEIPSVFGVGDKDFEKEIRIDSRNREGLILKIK